MSLQVNQIKSLALILLILVLNQIQLLANGLAIDQRSMSSQTIDSADKVSSVTEPTVVVGPTTTTFAITNRQQQLEQRSDNNHLARQQQQQQRDHRRPVWAIAHMVNSIKELNYRLSSGANAIEADVTFGTNGEPLFTYHGFPCDCWRHCHQRENFNDYLSYVREIAIDQSDGIGSNLTLLFLDLKLNYLDHRGKINAGIELANSVLKNLFINPAATTTTTTTTTTTNEISNKQQQQNSHQEQQKQSNNLPADRPFHLIISVNHVSDVELIRNFINQLDVSNSSQLMGRIGFEVGMNDDIQQIEAMWRRFNGATLNVWQGDGFTNYFSPFYNLERLSKALIKRDQKLGYPAKVYHWTIDLHDRIRESLMMGVDAIMTNHPERLLAILQEPEIAHEFRLANRHDDPFEKLDRRQVGRSGETARYQRSASSTSGGLLRNLLDIISSGLRYVREIPQLSFITTTATSGLYSRPSTSSRRRTASLPSQPLGVTRVSLQNQPTYKLESFANYAQAAQQLAATAANTTSTTTTTTTTNSAIERDERGLANSVGQRNGDTQVVDTLQPYTGPKWYTSLISNVLVSILKTVLPVQSK